MRSIRKIVVLGGNGTMGSGSAALFASRGITTVILARTLDKARAGAARATKLLEARGACAEIGIGTYGDLGEIEDADLVLEAVAEHRDIKQRVLAQVDAVRRPATIVATVSSCLSIERLCDGRSPGFRRNFLGIHLFNPPMAIVGCELIPHRETDPGVVAIVRDFLATRLDREVVETADRPGFAGNRIGFKVLNEVAQLAEEHGVAYMDELLGTHSGRALPPLATIDLVGWDVHRVIVDNLSARTYDTAHDSFRIPDYMVCGIELGHLGRKTRDKGGFYKLEGSGAQARMLVLDPANGDYQPLVRTTSAIGDAMRSAIRAGDTGYRNAMAVLCGANGKDAELLRRVVLGYISYGLGLVGEVVPRARDVDRIMAFGFRWAPPSALVDAIGPTRTITLLASAKLPVPPVVIQAARHERALFDESVDTGQFFLAA